VDLEWGIWLVFELSKRNWNYNFYANEPHSEYYDTINLSLRMNGKFIICWNTFCIIQIIVKPKISCMG